MDNGTYQPWRICGVPKMFVKQVNIQEFRGIKNCNNPLEFSDFTVLIGRNNSGKSSVLEALSLLPFPHTGFRLPYYNESRTELLAQLLGGKSSLVYAYSGFAKIEYVIKDKKWTLSFDERSEPKLEIENIPPEHMLSNPQNSTAKALGILPGIETTREINRMVFFIPNDTSFLEKISSAMQEVSNRDFIIKTGAHVRVAKLINDCVDDEYSEVLFSPELRFRKELPDNIFYIKIKDLGDGIKKIILLFLWLEALKPALILWDDFEGSAHPSLISKVLSWLEKRRKDYNWQIILATHSIDVLNTILDLKPVDTKVIQLKKTTNDVLIHKNLDLEELENLFDANQDPRKLVDLLEI